MRKRINVTADDIANGTPVSSESCPVALAANRAFDGRETHFGISTWGFFDSATIHRLSPRVGSWIVAYDDGLGVEPFSFTVTV